MHGNGTNMNFNNQAAMANMAKVLAGQKGREKASVEKTSVRKATVNRRKAASARRSGPEATASRINKIHDAAAKFVPADKVVKRDENTRKTPSKTSTKAAKDGKGKEILGDKELLAQEVNKMVLKTRNIQDRNVQSKIVQAKKNPNVEKLAQAGAAVIQDKKKKEEGPVRPQAKHADGLAKHGEQAFRVAHKLISADNKEQLAQFRRMQADDALSSYERQEAILAQRVVDKQWHADSEYEKQLPPAPINLKPSPSQIAQQGTQAASSLAKAINLMEFKTPQAA